MFDGEMTNYFNYHKIHSFITPIMRQSKTIWQITGHGSQVTRNSVFYCNLLPVWQQMAIKNSVSKDFRSTASIVLTFSIAAYPVCLLIYWIRSQDNLKQGLGVINIFHVSVEKITLFCCMFHDAMVDISAYNWKKYLELLVLERKVYNNDDITFSSIYKGLLSPRVICCRLNHFTVRAATHYYTQAWQTLIYGKKCFILLVKPV